MKLAVEASKGLSRAARRIENALGFLAPSRSTYQALWAFERVEDLPDKERFRVFLLLVAAELDPEEWGVRPVNVPEVLDMDLLCELVRRQGLEPRTRWLSGTGLGLFRTRHLFNDHAVR